MKTLIPRGYRKVSLGFAFLLLCAVTSVLAILNPSQGFSGVNLGTMYGGISIGVIGIVWGNIAEHRARRQEELITP